MVHRNMVRLRNLTFFGKPSKGLLRNWQMLSPNTILSTSPLTGLQMHATNVFAMSTVPVQLIRGGAAEAAFDLTRARIRLEGLSSYGVIAVLLMNSALRLYTSVPKNQRSRRGRCQNWKCRNYRFHLSQFTLHCKWNYDDYHIFSSGTLL